MRPLMLVMFITLDQYPCTSSEPLARRPRKAVVKKKIDAKLTEVLLFQLSNVWQLKSAIPRDSAVLFSGASLSFRKGIVGPPWPALGVGESTTNILPGHRSDELVDKNMQPAFFLFHVGFHLQ